MSVSKLIKREFWLSLWVGGIPSLLIVIFNGHKSYHHFVTSIAPTDEIIMYFLGLLAIQVILFLRIVYYQKKSIEHRDKLFSLYSFWGQVGFTLLGVFRAILGASIVTLGVTLCYINIFDSPALLSKASLVIITFLLGSSLFSFLQMKMTIDQRSPS